MVAVGATTSGGDITFTVYMTTALADSLFAVTLTSYVPGLLKVYSGASSVLVLPSPKSYSAETMPGASRTLNWMVSGAVPDICCWETLTGITGGSAVFVAVAVGVASTAAVVAVGGRVSFPHAPEIKILMLASASIARHIFGLTAVFK